MYRYLVFWTIWINRELSRIQLNHLRPTASSLCRRAFDHGGNERARDHSEVGEGLGEQLNIFYERLNLRSFKSLI